MLRDGCKNGEVFKPEFVFLAKLFISRIIFKTFISKIEKFFFISRTSR